MPIGNLDSGSGRASHQTKIPEFPPFSKCLHSTCIMKFSYIFSDRTTPMGLPVFSSNVPLAFQVSAEVFTSIQRIRFPACPWSASNASKFFSTPNSKRVCCAKRLVGSVHKKQSNRGVILAIVVHFSNPNIRIKPLHIVQARALFKIYRIGVAVKPPYRPR